MPPTKKTISAKVVAVDPSVEPVEAEIVSDRRPQLGKRLGTFAIALLVLFFGINGYISSARNNDLLHRAAEDRTQLVKSNKNLVEDNHKLVKSQQHILYLNERQTVLIRDLRHALRNQNKILRRNGFETVVIPGSSESNGSSESPTSNQKDPNKDKKEPKKKHHHKPNNNPPPNNPDPTDPVTKPVCNLTGICLQRIGSLNVSNYQQQGVRRIEVCCASSTPSLWSIIFGVGSDLEPLQW